MSVLEEKVSISSVEPLVLRPPVGSEVYDNPMLRFRTFFSSAGSKYNRKLLLRIFCMSLLLVVLLVALFLFTWSILGFAPHWLSSSFRRGFFTHPSSSSTCGVFVPALRLRLTETISTADDMFLVTMLGSGDSSTMEKTEIFYLCKNRLTVIRRNSQCFIRPMRDEWYDWCSRGYADLLQKHPKMPDSVEASVKDQVLFTQPFSKTIDNTYVYSFCQGASAFVLLSQPPTDGYVVDTPMDLRVDQSSVGSQQPLVPADEESSVMDVIQEQESRSGSDVEFFDKGATELVAGRFRRHSPHHGDKKQEHQITNDHTLKHCKELPSVLEGAIIPIGLSTSSVSIIRDRLIFCPS